MSFEFQCPCGKMLSAKSDWVGKPAQCPSCGAIVLVPSPQAGAARSAPASRSPDPRRQSPRHRAAGRSVSRGTPPGKSRRALALQLMGVAGVLLLAASAFLASRWGTKPRPAAAEQPTPSASSSAEDLGTPPQMPSSDTTETGRTQPPGNVALAPPDTPRPRSGQTTSPRRYGPLLGRIVHGYLRRGIYLTSGEEIGLLLDPSRRAVTISASSDLTGRVLRRIAANAETLTSCLAQSRRFSQGLRVEDRDASQMLHVAVFPADNSGGATTDFVTFSPGPVTSAADLVRLDGEATEMEHWDQPAREALGLGPAVYWWDAVGISVSPTGQITHVLLRGPVEHMPAKP